MFHALNPNNMVDNINTKNKESKSKDGLFRVLTLDGGGSKGFYTLGVLKEIEGMLKSPLHENFDLIFGTSTGSIIAALIALEYKVDEIHDLYKKYVPKIMKEELKSRKSEELANLLTKYSVIKHLIMLKRV